MGKRPRLAPVPRLADVNTQVQDALLRHAVESTRHENATTRVVMRGLADATAAVVEAVRSSGAFAERLVGPDPKRPLVGLDPGRYAQLGPLVARVRALVSAWAADAARETGADLRAVARADLREVPRRVGAVLDAHLGKLREALQEDGPPDEPRDEKGKWTTGSAGAGSAPERPWRGMKVDAGLKDSWLERLNANTVGSVVSTNEGHPALTGGKVGPVGGTAYPDFALTVWGSGPDAEAKAEALATTLRGAPDTVVDTRYWRGQYGNWVTHENGIPRLGVFSQAEIDAHPTDRATVNVRASFENTGKNQARVDAWWESVLARLPGAEQDASRAEFKVDAGHFVATAGGAYLYGDIEGDVAHVYFLATASGTPSQRAVRTLLRAAVRELRARGVTTIEAHAVNKKVAHLMRRLGAAQVPEPASELELAPLLRLSLAGLREAALDAMLGADALLEDGPPDEARDERGRWTAGGVSVTGGSQSSQGIVRELLSRIPVTHLRGLGAVDVRRGVTADGPVGGLYYAPGAASKLGYIIIDEGRLANLTHEVGHHVHLAGMTDADRAEWSAYSNGARAARVSSYARTDEGEHFAEAYKAFYNRALTRESLKRLEPTAYAFIASLGSRLNEAAQTFGEAARDVSDEPRDPHGQWTSGGGAATAEAPAATFEDRGEGRFRVRAGDTTITGDVAGTFARVGFLRSRAGVQPEATRAALRALVRGLRARGVTTVETMAANPKVERLLLHLGARPYGPPENKHYTLTLAGLREGVVDTMLGAGALLEDGPPDEARDAQGKWTTGGGAWGASGRLPSIESDPAPGGEFEYHTTMADLPTLALNGLRGSGRGEHISVAPHLESAHFWAAAMADRPGERNGHSLHVLRMRRTDLAAKKVQLQYPSPDGESTLTAAQSKKWDREGTREHWVTPGSFTGNSVPPHVLEVYYGGGWKPLRDFRKQLQEDGPPAALAEAGPLQDDLAEAPGDLSQLDVPFNSAPDAQLTELLGTPLGGAAYDAAFADLGTEMVMGIRRALTAGLAGGKGVPFVARLIQGLMGGARWKAERIVRSEYGRVAGQAALATFAANPDVVSAVQWVATLDGPTKTSDGTCLQCAVLDGRTWENLDAAPRPVVDTHPNCRCRLIPVVRGAEALGLPPGSRASFSGQVPATLDYEDWFAQQDDAFQRSVLGPTRYDLYQGGASLGKFATASGIVPVRSLESDSEAAERLLASLSEDAERLLASLGEAGADDDCEWVTIRGYHVCIKGGHSHVGGKAGAPPKAAVSVSPAAGRAWSGAATPTKASLSKQERGALGEAIAVAWLRQKGWKDAAPVNAGRPNFPVDVAYDTTVLEVKTGTVDNQRGAQQWRLTIGQPGPKEAAWLRRASPAAKAQWNRQKVQDIMDRKFAVAQALSKALGKTVAQKTLTLIVNPDRKLADLYWFPGFHQRIGWSSEEARRAYAGTVRYR